MARIPTADDLDMVMPSAGRPLDTISGEQKSQMLAPAKDLANFGNAATGALTTIGGAIKQRTDANDDYEITKAMIRFDREQERQYEESKRAMPEGGDGFADGWRKTYDAQAKGLYGGLKKSGVSNEALGRLDENLLRWGEKLHTRATRDEIAERGRYWTDDVYKNLTDAENRVAERPDRVREEISAAQALINSNRYLPPGKRHELARKYPAMLEEVAARALMDRDPETAIEALQRRPRGDIDDSNDPGTAPARKSLMGDQQKTSLKGVKPDIVGRLAELQGEFGREFNVNSGARSPLGNRAAGGVDGSQHLSGNAVDIDVRDLSPAERTKLVEKASALGFTGIGVYDNALHLDMGERRAWGPSKHADSVPAWAKDVVGRHLEGKIRAGATQRPVGPGNVSEPGQPGGPASSESDTYGGPSSIPADGGPDSDPAPQWSFEDTAQFKHLPFKDRQRLLNVARVSMRETIAKAIADDVELIRDGKTPSKDARGRTSLERADVVMTKNQVAKAKNAWDEAKLEAEAVLPLRSMNEIEALKHLDKYLPGDASDGEGYRMRDKVFDKARKQWGKIQEARQKDFAVAVDAEPEVKETRAELKNLIASKNVGTGEDRPSDRLSTAGRVSGPIEDITPQLARERIIEARYAAQRRLLARSPDDKSTDGLRPITKAESQELLGIVNMRELDPDKLNDTLKKAADKAEQKYGPKHGRKAYETAIYYLLSEKAARDEAKGVATTFWSDSSINARAEVMGKIAAGERLTISDRRRVQALDAAAQPAAALERTPAPAEPSRLGAFAAAGKMTVKPTAAQKEFLRKNPDAAADFDKRFGPGAAAGALKGE